MKILGGNWECFPGVKFMEEPHKSPIIICRPQTNKATSGYFIFHKNRVIIEKPETMNIIDNPPVKIIVQK